MMIPKRQPESSHRSPRMSSWLFLPFLFVSIPAGCQSGPPPAPPSTHVLSQSQVDQAMELLATVAQESPEGTSVPLDLLPPDGIRWDTIRDAVSHAVAVSELQMAIAQATDISETEKMFFLIDSHAWPATITVRRIDEQPGVEVEVLMGPDPSSKRRRIAARDVARRVLDSIRLYGRIKRLEPYEAQMTPRRVVSPMIREAASDISSDP